MWVRRAVSRKPTRKKNKNKTMGRASRNARGRLHYIRLATSAEGLIVVEDTVSQVELGTRGKEKRPVDEHGKKWVMLLEPLSSAGCWGHFIKILVIKRMVLSRR
jgi:hypothetical protein